MGVNYKLRREGDPEGSAEVGFDKQRKQNYHLTYLGKPEYHGVPVGFHFDDDGNLVGKQESPTAGLADAEWRLRGVEPLYPGTEKAPTADTPVTEAKEKNDG